MTALIDKSGAYVFTDSAQQIVELLKESHYALRQADMVGWLFHTRALPNYLKQMYCYDVIIEFDGKTKIVDLTDFGHAYFDVWSRLGGSLDQCREAVERMEPKKVKKIQIPNTSWSKACTRFECPSCNKFLNYMELSHCGLCGQHIDWSE